MCKDGLVHSSRVAAYLRDNREVQAMYGQLRTRRILNAPDSQNFGTDSFMAYLGAAVGNQSVKVWLAAFARAGYLLRGHQGHQPISEQDLEDLWAGGQWLAVECIRVNFGEIHKKTFTLLNSMHGPVEVRVRVRKDRTGYEYAYVELTGKTIRLLKPHITHGDPNHPFHQCKKSILLSHLILISAFGGRPWFGGIEPTAVIATHWFCDHVNGKASSQCCLPWHLMWGCKKTNMLENLCSRHAASKVYTRCYIRLLRNHPDVRLPNAAELAMLLKHPRLRV